MGGSLLQLVASGIESLYLSGSPDITLFKNVYRRYSNFSLVPRKKLLNDVNQFNYEGKYKLQKEADFINGITFNINLSDLELDYPQLTIEYLMQILNKYNIKTDLLVDYLDYGPFDVDQLLNCFSSGDIITLDDYNNVVKPFLYEYIAYYINNTHNIKYILFDNTNTKTNIIYDRDIAYSTGNDYYYYFTKYIGYKNAYMSQIIYPNGEGGIFYYDFDASGYPTSTTYKYNHLLYILVNMVYINQIDKTRNQIDYNEYTLDQFNRIQSLMNFADGSGVPYGYGFTLLNQTEAISFLDNLLISTYNNLLDCDNFEFIYPTTTYEGINNIISLIKQITIVWSNSLSLTQSDQLTSIYNNLITIKNLINAKLYVTIQIYDIYNALYTELLFIYNNTLTNNNKFLAYLDNYIILINFLNNIVLSKYERNTDYRSTYNYISKYYSEHTNIVNPILNILSTDPAKLLFNFLDSYYLDLEYYNYVDLSGNKFNKTVYNMTNIKDILYNDYFSLLKFYFPIILGPSNPNEKDINGNYFPFETNYFPNPLSPLRTYAGLTVTQKKQYFYFEYGLGYNVNSLLYVLLDILSQLVNFKIISGDISSTLYELILKKSNEFINNPLFTVFTVDLINDPLTAITDISITEPFITLKQLIDNNNIVIYYENDLQYQLITIIKYFIKKNYYINYLLIQQILNIMMYSHNSENYYRFGYYKTFTSTITSTPISTSTIITSDTSIFTSLYNNGILGMDDNISSIVTNMNVNKSELNNFFFLNYFNNQFNVLNDSNVKNLNISIINDYFNEYSLWSNLLLSSPIIKNIFQNLSFNFLSIDLSLINLNYTFDASGVDVNGNPTYIINYFNTNYPDLNIPNIYDYYFSSISNKLILQNLIITNYQPLLTIRDIMDEIYNRFNLSGLDQVDSSGNFRYSTLLNFKDLDELVFYNTNSSFTPNQKPTKPTEWENFVYMRNRFEGQILKNNQIFKNELYQEVLLNIILKSNYNYRNINTGTVTPNGSIQNQINYSQYKSLIINNSPLTDVSGYDPNVILNTFDIADLDYMDSYCNNYLNSSKIGLINIGRPENYIEFTVNSQYSTNPIYNYRVKLPFIIGIIQKIRYYLIKQIYNYFILTNPSSPNFIIYEKIVSLINYVIDQYIVYDTYNHLIDTKYTLSSYLKNGYTFFNIKNDFVTQTNLPLVQNKLLYQRYSHGPSSVMSYINSKFIQNYNLTMNNLFDKTYYKNNIGIQFDRMYDTYILYLNTNNVGSDYNNYYAPQADIYNSDGFIILDNSGNPYGDISNNWFFSDNIVREYFFDTYYNGTYNSGAATDVYGITMQNINGLASNIYYRTTSLLKGFKYIPNVSSYGEYSYSYDPTNSYLYPIINNGINVYALNNDKTMTFKCPTNMFNVPTPSVNDGYISFYKYIDNIKVSNTIQTFINNYSNNALLTDNVVDLCGNLIYYTDVFSFYSKSIDNTQLTSVTNAVDYYYNSIDLSGIPFDPSGVRNNIINNPEINVIGSILYRNTNITPSTTNDIQYCGIYNILEKLYSPTNQYYFNVDLSGNIVDLLTDISGYYTSMSGYTSAILTYYLQLINDDSTQLTRGKYVSSMFYNKYVTSYFNNFQNKSDIVLYVLLQIFSQSTMNFIINNINRNNRLIRDNVQKYFRENIINSQSIVNKYITKYQTLTNRYDFNDQNNLGEYYSDYYLFFINKYQDNIINQIQNDSSGNNYVNYILDISYNHVLTPTETTNVTNITTYLINFITLNLNLLLIDDGFYIYDTFLTGGDTQIITNITNDKLLPLLNAKYTTINTLINMYLNIITIGQLFTIDIKYTAQNQIQYNNLNTYIPLITMDSIDASNNVVYEDSELDKLLLNIITTNLSDIPFDWVNHIGFRLFDYINIKCDDILIDEYKPELLALYSKLNLNGTQLQILPKFINYDPNNKNNFNLILPMDFWFRDNPLPMINVLYSDIYINFKVTDLLNVLILDDPLIIVKKPPKLKINIIVDYVYIEKEEREKLARSKLEFLIQRYRYGGLYNLTVNNIINNKIKVQFRLYDPTKYIVWRLKVKNNDKKNWDVNGFGNTQISNYIKLYFNGSVREQAQDSFFNSVQPYCRYLGSIDSSEYIHTYALFPKILQPSGSANLTNIEEIWIEHELTQDFINNFKSSDILEFEVWSLSYQLLRLISGIMAPAFLY